MSFVTVQWIASQRNESSNQKGVDPVIAINDSTIHKEIYDFYGLHNSIDLYDHLVSRNWEEGSGRPKRCDF